MVCNVCKKEIDEKSNFCPNCGKAISDIAKKIEDTKITATKLKVVAEIVEKIDDVKTLDVLKKYAAKIKTM